MARVPTEEFPQEELKPTPINPKTAATLGGEVIDLAEGIGVLGDKIQKVQNATDVRKGLTGLTQDTINIHNQISQEPDLTKAESKAQDMLQKSLEERGSKIGDFDAREAYLNRGNALIDRSMVSINSMIAAKQLQQSKTSLTDYGNMFVSEYANLSRPDQMKAAVDDFSREVDLNVQNGTTSPWMGQAYKNQYIYKAKFAQASHDIELDPDNALKQLQLGDKGMHPDLKTTDRDKLIDRAESKIQRNQEKSDKLLKVGQQKNLDDAVMKQTMGSLSDDKAEEMFYQKQISQKGYESLIKNGTSPHVIDAKTDPDKYNDAVQMLLRPNVPSFTEDVPVEGYSGNIKLAGRPTTHNADGSWSSEKSFSFQDTDGKEVLIPSIVNGKELSKKDAIANYRKTGENLGKFDSPADADAMANKIHSRYNQKGYMSDEDKRTALIDMNSDGTLATSDMKHLYQLHLIPNKGESESLGQTQQGRKDLQLLDKAEKDDKQLKERSKSLQGAWDRITGHSDDPHNVSDLLQKLHSDLAKEQNVTPQIIQEKTTEVINGDNLKRNPQLANLPKEGHTVMNNHTGKVYWARPDGKGGVEITPYGKSNGQ